MSVFDLKKGERGEVVKVNLSGAEAARLSSLGVERGCVVSVAAFSFFKAAQLIVVGANRIALRREIARAVEVKRL